MQTILTTIAPVFGLIAIGYTAARTRYLPASAADGLAAFVFALAMPTLLFRTIATAEFGQGRPLALWAVYFCGVLVAFAGAVLVARRLGRVDRRTGVVAGVATSFSNLVLIGIPLTERVFGPAGITVLALLLTVHLPIMVTVSSLLVEDAAMRDARDGLTQGAPFSYGAALRRVWRSLSRNALIAGIVLGLVWRFAGLSLVGPLAEIVDGLAATAGSLALLSLGLSLPRYRLAGALKLPLGLAFLALVLQPAVVWAAGTLAGLPPLWLGVAVLGAAAPSGVNAYLLAVYFRSGEDLAASITVITTVMSALTLTGWITLVSQL